MFWSPSREGFFLTWGTILNNIEFCSTLPVFAAARPRVPTISIYSNASGHCIPKNLPTISFLLSCMLLLLYEKVTCQIECNTSKSYNNSNLSMLLCIILLLYYYVMCLCALLLSSLSEQLHILLPGLCLASSVCLACRRPKLGAMKFKISGTFLKQYERW